MAAKKTAATKTAKKTAAKKAAAKRMGRPPRADGAASQNLVVRVTAAERGRLDLAAERAGKRVSDFVRDAALSQCEKS